MEENQEPETINNELIEEEEEQNSDQYQEQEQEQDQDQEEKEEEEEEEKEEEIIEEEVEEIITTIEPNHLTSSSDSPLSEWRDLIEAVESALTITPVEDPEAERLERILDTVNDYINSEFVDENIPEVEKMGSKISKFKNSVTSIVTKISKYAPVPFNAIRSSSSFN